MLFSHRSHKLNLSNFTSTSNWPTAPYLNGDRSLAFGFGRLSFDLLAVEADRRHGVQILIEFESIQSSGFARRIEAKHDDVNLVE